MQAFNISRARLKTEFNIRTSLFREAAKDIINSGNLPVITTSSEAQVALAISENLEAEDDLIAHFIN